MRPDFFHFVRAYVWLKSLEKKKKKKEAEEKIKILRYTTRFMRLQACYAV